MPTIAGRIKVKTDTSDNWTSNNPILLSGEIGYNSTDKYFVIGDGTSNYNNLIIYNKFISMIRRAESDYGLANDEEYSDDMLYQIVSDEDSDTVVNYMLNGYSLSGNRTDATNETGTKIYLVGAASQTKASKTNSNSALYLDANNRLTESKYGVSFTESTSSSTYSSIKSVIKTSSSGFSLSVTSVKDDDAGTTYTNTIKTSNSKLTLDAADIAITSAKNITSTASGAVKYYASDGYDFYDSDELKLSLANSASSIYGDTTSTYLTLETDATLYSNNEVNITGKNSGVYVKGDEIHNRFSNQYVITWTNSSTSYTSYKDILTIGWEGDAVDWYAINENHTLTGNYSLSIEENTEISTENYYIRVGSSDGCDIAFSTDYPTGGTFRLIGGSESLFNIGVADTATTFTDSSNSRKYAYGQGFRMNQNQINMGYSCFDNTLDNFTNNLSTGLTIESSKTITHNTLEIRDGRQVFSINPTTSSTTSGWYQIATITVVDDGYKYNQAPLYIEYIHRYYAEDYYPTAEPTKLYIKFKGTTVDKFEVSGNCPSIDSTVDNTVYLVQTNTGVYDLYIKVFASPDTITITDFYNPTSNTDDKSSITVEWHTSGTLLTTQSSNPINPSILSTTANLKYQYSYDSDTSYLYIKFDDSDIYIGDDDNSGYTYITNDCIFNENLEINSITGIKVDGVYFSGTDSIIHYGTCSTAAATAAKTVSCSGFRLDTGSRITVKFTITNTASSPTLNVNGTGAKAIYYRGAAISAGYLAENRTYTFVYNGTQYELIGDINTDSNTTYSAGTGLSLSSNTFSLATVTSSSTTSTAAPAHSGSFTVVDSVTRDSYGRVTAVNTKTVTLPADNNTTYSAATTSSAGLMSASDKSKLDAITASADAVSFTQSLTSGTAVGTITINGTDTILYAPTNTDTHYSAVNYLGTTGATSNATTATSNTTTFLTLRENSTTRSNLQIKGAGGTTVSAVNGVLTITSTDNNTTYSAGTGLSLSSTTFSLASVTQSDTTSTASPAHSGTFTVVDSVTRDSYGRVTGINTKTITLPSDNNTDTKVTNTLGTTTKFYITGTTSSSTNTGTQYFDTGVYVSTTAGQLVASSFSGNGASLTSLNATNISSGTLAAARLASSGVTAGSYGPSASVSPAHSGTFSVPYITVDDYGRVTSATTQTITLPSDNNTDTKVTNTVNTSGTKFYITGTTSASTNTSTQIFDTSVYVSNDNLYVPYIAHSSTGQKIWLNGIYDDSDNLLSSNLGIGLGTEDSLGIHILDNLYGGDIDYATNSTTGVRTATLKKNWYITDEGEAYFNSNVYIDGTLNAVNGTEMNNRVNMTGYAQFGDGLIINSDKITSSDYYSKTLNGKTIYGPYIQLSTSAHIGCTSDTTSKGLYLAISNGGIDLNGPNDSKIEFDSNGKITLQPGSSTNLVINDRNGTNMIQVQNDTVKLRNSNGINFLISGTGITSEIGTFNLYKYGTSSATEVIGIDTDAQTIDINTDYVLSGPTATTENDGLMSSSDKKNIIYFVAGTQTAATNAFTGVLEDVEALYDGLTINYWLPYSGTSTAATLNLTLSDGTTTGAIKVYINSGTSVASLTTHYYYGNHLLMTYRSSVSINGTTYTGWFISDRNTDTYNRLQHNVAIKAVSAITSANLIVNAGSGYFHLKTGSAFDITYPILYAGSAISASSTGTNNFLAIAFTVTTTQSITLTAYSPVFIKGTLSGTTFTPISTTPLTQTIPTTEDGYQYIYLGLAYSTTAIYLQPYHPVYEYKNQKFGLYSRLTSGTIQDSSSTALTLNSVYGITIDDSDFSATLKSTGVKLEGPDGYFANFLCTGIQFGTDTELDMVSISSSELSFTNNNFTTGISINSTDENLTINSDTYINGALRFNYGNTASAYLGIYYGEYSSGVQGIMIGDIDDITGNNDFTIILNDCRMIQSLYVGGQLTVSSSYTLTSDYSVATKKYVDDSISGISVSDTKVTNTLATTTKAYITGTSTATTNTGTQIFDTGVYLTTTAGQLYANSLKLNGGTFSLDSSNNYLTLTLGEGLFIDNTVQIDNSLIIVDESATVTLSKDPTNDMHAATKQYVDNNSSMPYVTCSTAASTENKVVTIDNFEWSSSKAHQVVVKFTYGTSVTSRLYVNSTYKYNIEIQSGDYDSFSANSVLVLLLIPGTSSTAVGTAYVVNAY